MATSVSGDSGLDSPLKDCDTPARATARSVLCPGASGSLQQQQQQQDVSRAAAGAAVAACAGPSRVLGESPATL